MQPSPRSSAAHQLTLHALEQGQLKPTLHRATIYFVTTVNLGEVRPVSRCRRSRVNLDSDRFS